MYKISVNYSVISESTIPNAFGNESFIFRWGGGQNFLVIYCGRIGRWVAGGQRKGKRVIYFVSHIVFVCGGGGGGECKEDQNSSISLHVSEMFKLLGAFTPEMPITLSFLDSVLYEIQNKETKKKKKKEREREKRKS